MFDENHSHSLIIPDNKQQGRGGAEKVHQYHHNGTNALSKHIYTHTHMTGQEMGD